MSTATQQQQRDRALASANRVRLDRAQVKRELRRGERSIRETLLDPPACLNTMSIVELLLMTPRYGSVRVNRLLTRVNMSPRRPGISPNRAVMALTERQRQAIVDELGRL